MILFTIIVLAIVLLLALLIALASAVGAGVIVIFGDVIICLILLIWVAKKLVFKKRN